MASSCILVHMVGCPAAAPRNSSIKSEERLLFPKCVAVKHHSHLARMNLGHLRRDRLPQRSVSAQAFEVTGPGSINSPMMTAMQEKIKEALEAEEVVVKDAHGDGRHVSIDVVSTLFEGKRSVERQRMVYKAIWEELQSTVHAVDAMTTKTPSEV